MMHVGVIKKDEKSGTCAIMYRIVKVSGSEAPGSLGTVMTLESEYICCSK
jgi:hypothetical protein